MEITKVIEWINKEKQCNISADYYKNIDKWKQWWMGDCKEFHEFKTIENDKVVARKLFTLGMAKKASEDWASILLNEKTEIAVQDPENADFIDSVLEENGFWKLGNELVEKAFYSGTGAFVVKIKDMEQSGEAIKKSPGAKVHIDYLPAGNIVPLTVRNGQIVEAAFASEVFDKGQTYIYLEMHELVLGKYEITNKYFETTNGQLKLTALPHGVLNVVKTGSDIPLFTIFSPNIVNNIPKSNGLGASVYANAIDNLQGVDLAFNNLCRDFKLGGKKVFYSESLILTNEEGKKITPDDVMQQLFTYTGDGPMTENGQNTLITEYNPDLRVQDNKDGIQAQLDYLSFKVGFGTKHYQFNGGQIVTATQYTGDKQELVQNASKHYIAIERALKTLVRAILWVGKEVMGKPVNPDSEVTVQFEDSYIIDKESERLRDLQEIRDGLMQKWEYRVKWYGEDEKTAKQMIGADLSDAALMGFTSPNETGGAK
ncbi:phage portal protein [Aminipila butyrica]|uniref:Phage portal protein n=1 Tax=Aminipila butyrica TaxID=433296 RepID=A0A858BRS2_9FIRM|nr:phage portal protein [Aminipila butyrica]QIB68257.1 phage portal protein [Aminipila butyrica]